jgi:hypothetical protein
MRQIGAAAVILNERSRACTISKRPLRGRLALPQLNVLKADTAICYYLAIHSPLDPGFLHQDTEVAVNLAEHKWNV